MFNLYVHRAWRLRLIVLAAAILVALAIGEAALRLAGVSFPNPYRPDAYCGTRLQPNFEGWFTKEGRAWVQINSAGWRDCERQEHKGPGVFRIAVLGDSFSEALQVPLEQTYWRQLEHRLNASVAAGGGPTFEVLNFGVSGYATCQQLESYRRAARAYEPDLVVLQFFVENDLYDNTPDLASDLTRPFLLATSDGSWDVDYRFRDSPEYLAASSPAVRRRVWLANHLRLWQVAREVRARWRSSNHGTAQEAPLRWQCYQLRHDQAWRNAWLATEQAVKRLRDEVVADGAALVILVVSAPNQVHPHRARRAAVIEQLGVDDLFQADRRLIEMADSLEVPILTLGQAFQHYADQTGDYLHGFAPRLGEGHWNELGHRRAAEALARWLAEVGLVLLTAQ